jgi:hypothetical protein
MDESDLWTFGVPAGLALLGGAGGALGLALGVSAAGFAAAFFVATFLASGLAMQLYRRGSDRAVLVGSVSGALSMLAFFAVPIGASAATGVGDVDEAAAVMLLVVAPLAAGGIAGAGTLVLTDGVRRYRAQHGMRHAPR